MTTNRHSIMRQTLDIAFNGKESDAMALHRTLPDICARKLMPAIETVLNRYDTPNGFLTIEKLEIDAGNVSIEGLERELPRLVAEALEKAMQESQHADLRQSVAETTDNFRQKTKPESLTEALLFFLENGTLPWFFSPRPIANFESEIQEAWAKAIQTGSIIRSLKTDFVKTLRSPAARARLTSQFSPVFLESVLGLLSDEGNWTTHQLMERLRHATVSPAQIKRLETLLWEQAFVHVASEKVFTEALLIKEIKLRLTVSDVRDVELETLLTSLLPEESETVIAKSRLSGESKKEGQTEPHQAKEQPETQIPFRKDKRQENKEKTGETHRKTLEEQKSSSGKSDEPTELEKPVIKKVERLLSGEAHPDRQTGIYIDHAGLVLLHPFLPQFFRGLGVANDEILLRPNRALYLLHFLATGEHAAPEYDLVLPKVLCGLPIESVTEPEEALRAEEEEEISALLMAVIRHWDVLRNTSPEGLRETFLKRSGKLSQRGNGDWQLQVESKGYDILLDQLPWGISMIKLHWMPRMLWVEWLS